MKAFVKASLSLLTVAVSCGFLAEPSQAAANPVVGTIDFNGVVTYDTTSLATATKVNIWNTAYVTKDTLDFTSVAPGSNVTLVPWTFDSGTPAFPAPGPSTPTLWTVGGFTFDLTSSMVVSQSSTFLNVTGVGTVSGNGFTPTAGTWSFTSSRAGGQDSQTFGFQSSTAVPEASSLTLIAMGSVLLGGVCFFRRNARRHVAAANALFR
jgi:hypothetical protein